MCRYYGPRYYCASCSAELWNETVLQECQRSLDGEPTRGCETPWTVEQGHRPGQRCERCQRNQEIFAELERLDAEREQQKLERWAEERKREKEAGERRERKEKEEDAFLRTGRRLVPARPGGFFLPRF